MSLHTSLGLFLAIHAMGLALWLSISVINNCRSFGGSVGAVGATMSMVSLKQPPAIDTPLLSRAIGSHTVHRAALSVVLALQIVAAAACWVGCWQLLVVGDLGAARPWLNLALSAFTAFLFSMHLGGLWFGYWIRQEGLQLTHIALLVWAVMAFFLLNTAWA
jgi:predicted small integral membrane protein